MIAPANPGYRAPWVVFDRGHFRQYFDDSTDSTVGAMSQMEIGFCLGDALSPPLWSLWTVHVFCLPEALPVAHVRAGL